MSLDVRLTATRTVDVYSANITHNLSQMAVNADLYEALWHPERIHPYPIAEHLIAPLRAGLGKLKARPEYFRQFNSPNLWGIYEHFVPFVEKYLAACEANPDAEVSVSR